MNQNELRALLVQATEDRPAGISLMPSPAPRRNRVLVPALASLGVAAAVGISVVGVPGTETSAQAQVVAAVDNTSKESFRIHTTSGPKTFDGAFAPARREGFIVSSDGSETRFVGDLMYIRTGSGKWLAQPRIEGVLKDAPAAVRLVKLAPQDPQAALQELRSATQVREDGQAAGHGWTGTRFTFRLSGDGDLKRGKVTGSVEIDAEGRVRRLAMNFGDGHSTIEAFSDFGTPVSVTAPPADQVEQAPKAGDKDLGKKP